MLQAGSFGFQNMWISHENFLKVVEQSWKEEMVVVNRLQILAGKLKRLKVVLRTWNKEVFRRVDEHIQELEERVKLLETAL